MIRSRFNCCRNWITGNPTPSGEVKKLIKAEFFGFGRSQGRVGADEIKKLMKAELVATGSGSGAGAGLCLQPGLRRQSLAAPRPGSARRRTARRTFEYEFGTSITALVYIRMMLEIKTHI
jgi:hypothetical protein